MVRLCVVPFTKLHQTLIKYKKMSDLNIFDENGKALHIGSVISRFLFDQSDNLKMQCNEICVTIDPCYKNDKWIDLVIHDDNWNELKRIKTLNGL